jgi:TrmH family RNA methyltransferase
LALFRIVLVRPETAANTGAAGLDLVAPGDWRTVECWRSAWGAHDLLEEARVFPRLEDALVGAALAIAFSGRRRSNPTPVDVREAAAAVARLGPDETAALVFGPETSGLTNAEIAACGRAAVIPAQPAQPSFNLSHAVAIACHEVHRGLRREAGAGPRRATHDEKERVLALLRQGLVAIEALPRVNREGYFEDWRTLVQRTEMTPKELKLLEHAARKMAQPRTS